MSFDPAAIEVRGVSKRYQLGTFGARSLRDELGRVLGRFRRRGGSGEASGSPPTGDFWALRDVSFDVRAGEVVGIIGQNGAGKSTLLKILSRITRQTAGEIKLRGRVASLLEVGTGFHPDLTGRENIFLNGAILGMTKREIHGKLDQIIAFAEVERFVDTPVKRYSSGMHVRLAFAVAAHLEPDILIVDEVLAVGDAEFQRKSLGKLGEVSRQGRTVLFVSHNMPVIETLCPRALWLHEGRLMDDGDSRQIVEQYLTRSARLSRDILAAGLGRHIRRVQLRNERGETDAPVFVGEQVTFDVELHHATPLQSPRVSISAYSPRGDRLVTIHTDVQQNERWSVEGTRQIRAVWHDVRLIPGTYRIDVAFWGFLHEIETLRGCLELEVLPRDIYGTGAMPDLSSQGYFLPDATWDLGPRLKSEGP